MHMISCSVWITENYDRLNSSLRTNKSRKHLLCKCNSSGNPSYSSPTRIYTQSILNTTIASLTDYLTLNIITLLL